jgi:hypothetical protein
MSKKPKRKKHTLQAGNFTLGAPTFDQPALTVTVPLQARSLELQFEKPGDSSADRRALQFFLALMRGHPNGVPGKKKDDHFHDCQEHLRAHGECVADRRLYQLWTRAIDHTGAVAFRKPGRDKKS